METVNNINGSIIRPNTCMNWLLSSALLVTDITVLTYQSIILVLNIVVANTAWIILNIYNNGSCFIYMAYVFMNSRKWCISCDIIPWIYIICCSYGNSFTKIHALIMGILRVVDQANFNLPLFKVSQYVRWWIHSLTCTTYAYIYIYIYIYMTSILELWYGIWNFTVIYYP